MSSRTVGCASIVLLIFALGLKVEPASAATPFVTETVDISGGTNSSLALDAQGNPRICHYANGDLKYAAKIAGVWVLETVDAPGDVGEYCSLALDALGRPRIS